MGFSPAGTELWWRLAELMPATAVVPGVIPSPSASALGDQSPSPSPSVSPSSSDPALAPLPLADSLADSVRAGTFLDAFLHWFIGVPLQIMIIIGLTLLAIGLVHQVINRAVKRFVAGAPEEPQPSSEPAGDDEVAARFSSLSSMKLRARRAQRATAIGSLLRSIFTVTAFMIALLTALPLIGINIAALLTSAGVIGVALGFGAQNLVKDYISGIYIVLEDQYGVSDMIEANGVVGEVEEVTLRVTRIRDGTGVVWYLRNGEILKVANRSQGWTIAYVDLAVTTSSSLSEVKQAVTAAAHEVSDDDSLSGSLLETPKYAGVESVNGDAMVIRVVAKAAPVDQVKIERELRAALLHSFEAAGISLAEMPPKSG